VNPNKLLKRIVFDPRIPSKIFEKRKDELIKLGFENEIIQSGLYRIREMELRGK
jgi:hypothetical protein